MFNIYIKDIILFPDNVWLSNYADDTTLYSIGENHNTKQIFFISPKMVLLQLHGKCCYMSFSCNPD